MDEPSRSLPGAQRGSQRRTVRHVVWAFVGFAVLACSPVEAPSTPPSPSPGVSVPTEQLPADIRSLVEHGARIVEVKPPLVSGDPPRYELILDLPPQEARRVSVECQKLASPHPPRTDAELRDIYKRWVDEYECLRELGYEPDPPPSVETFIAQWRSSSGPWVPTDGIDTGQWTDAQYREAKERCGLEFYERD